MKLKIPQYQLSEVLNMMAFKGISEADIKTMMDPARTLLQIQLHYIQSRRDNRGAWNSHQRPGDC